MEKNFERAKIVLEGILNREFVSRERYLNQLRDFLLSNGKAAEEDMDIYLEGKYFLRKDNSEFIVSGTKQIVLNVGSGYLAKTRPRPWNIDQVYVLSKSRVYEPQLIDTLQVLSELGFEVPEHHYMGVNIESNGIRVYDGGLAFVIAEDLTCGGRYVIQNIKDQHFQELANGAELKEQLTGAVTLFTDICDEKRLPYCGCVNDHVTIEGPEEAFRHMFFVQIDPLDSRGKLVLGDLDHVLLVKKAQHQ